MIYLLMRRCESSFEGSLGLLRQVELLYRVNPWI